MSGDSISVNYNQDLKPLEKLLEGVKRAGDFFVNGTVEIPMPKLEIKGVGVLSFPVPSTQIAALIGQATRAPYGRGEKTILDESVRKVWQLPPDKVRLSGKSWAANFDGILQQTISGLGCEGMAVSAELYKLLVYDAGGFFLAHRDTEKTDGMFGTLVVALPSAHRGGELVIRHAGREATVDLSAAEVSEVTFAAFYADCEHEVRPITEGNRVCLVYNLIQKRGAKQKGQRLHAPDYEKQVGAAAKLLEKNLAKPDAPTKIAWLLEFQYSPDGLSFAGLKSIDAARVKVLVQAAERAACAAHLAIVHIEESGTAEPEYSSHDWGGWGGYDEDETEDADSDEFEVVEVCDWRHYVNQWRDLQDQPVEFGEIPIGPGELLPIAALDDEEPDEQRLMEASGNAGASFERSYHRAALVIWRRERYAEVLLQAGVEAVLPYLQECIRECTAKNAPPAARTGAVALARRLVDAWMDAPAFGAYGRPARPGKRDGMLRLLVRLGDRALLEEFIAGVVTRDYDGGDNAALLASAQHLGPKKTGRLYAELVCENEPRLPGPCIDLLHALAFKGKLPANEDWRKALRQIAEAAVSGLDEAGREQRVQEWIDGEGEETKHSVDAAFVANLMDALSELDSTSLRGAAAEKFAVRSQAFDPVTVLIPALNKVNKWDAAIQRLWEHSAEFLLARSGRPPETPRDWRQNVKLSCTCADCGELQAFTLDPLEQTHRFRVRQDRRQHLHGMIVKHRLDMTHVTERKGSPQTLICTKDRRSYQRQCERYRKDIAALKSLAALEKKSSAKHEDFIKRIAAACGLAKAWSPV